MIIKEGHSNTNCSLPSKAFTIQNSPLAFEILSSRLYSNPSMAIVRELLTNAYDAQVLVGKENVPIKIELPTIMNPNFSIRDYGIGLEKEEVMLLYTSFFNSTKNTTNEFTGCFGLGSKTPFSYTTGFTVNSYKNGYKYKFLMVKKDMMPQVIYTSSEATDEPNGLEIIIPIAEDDFGLFRENFIKYLRDIPEIKTTQDHIIARYRIEYAFYPFEGVDDFIQLIFYKTQSSCSSSVFAWARDLCLKQGQNIYDIASLVDDISRESGITFKFLASMSHSYRLVVEVPIGTFEITPNREMLDSTAKTKDKLIKLFTKIEERALRYEFPDTTCFFKNESTLVTAIRYFKDSIIHNAFNNIYRKHNYIITRCGRLNNGNYTISWHKSYGNIYEYKHGSIIREHASVVSGLNLIIDIPLKYRSSKQTKFIYRLINYKEKFDKYDRILFNYIPTCTELTFDQSIKECHKFRDFKKALADIDEQLDKHIYIVHTNYNKIIRECPNDSMPECLKKKPTVVDTRTKILVSHSEITDYKYDSKREYDYYKNFSMHETRYLVHVDILSYLYSPVSTVVFYNEQSVNTNYFNYERPDWFEILTAFGDLPNEIIDTSSFNEFLKAYKTIDKPFVQARHMIGVAKRNLKYFKNYITIDVNDLIKYYQSLDLHIWKYQYDYRLRNLAIFIDSFLNHYPKNIRENIRKTSLFKKLEILVKLNSKVTKYDYNNYRYDDSYYSYVATYIIKTNKFKHIYYDLENLCKSFGRVTDILNRNESTRYNYAGSKCDRGLTNKGYKELLEEFFRR